MIWINPTAQRCLPKDAFNSRETAQNAGFYQHSSPFEARLLSGEIPSDWDNPVLPDFDKFEVFATNSDLWQYISVKQPLLAGMLFTALTARTPKINTVRGFMTQIVLALGDTDALHLQPSRGTYIDSDGIEQPFASMADELDYWLTQSHFGFTYTQLQLKDNE